MLNFKYMKVKGLRWWIIMLIFIATVINYIDRTAFALLWPEMGKDLGMDNSDYALMLNVFLFTYAFSKFLSGDDDDPADSDRSSPFSSRRSTRTPSSSSAPVISL